MCLRNVTKRHWFPRNEVVVAYKQLASIETTDTNATTYVGFLWDAPRGQWLTAKGGWHTDPFYKRGFHAYAENNLMFLTPVRLRRVRTEGVEWNGERTLVADEMYILTPEEVKQFETKKKVEAVTNAIAALNKL